jgi:Fe-S oxidoreductase
MEIIDRGRKLLVEKSIGPMPEQRKVLESIYMYGNPYTQPAEQRLGWLKDLKVKKLPSEKAEVLFFVGCSTSYEPVLHNAARSLVRLFQFFEVDFGVLEKEKCSAETVIRLGDEVLFEELSAQNIETFKTTGAKTIVTVSPHDFHTFLEDYQNLKDNFEIKHYTEFFANKLDGKKIEFKKEMSSTITYHDPCYLSKHHAILEAPRKILKKIPGANVVEMKLHGLDNLCCGGGGGRMFTEVEEEQRLSDMRVGQALEVGANVIATACPWCHIMLDNAVRDLKVDDKIKVMDVAEILAEALGL